MTTWSSGNTQSFQNSKKSSGFPKWSRVLVEDNLEKVHSITGPCDTDHWRQLQENTNEIWQGNLINWLIFHQDVTPSQKSRGEIVLI